MTLKNTKFINMLITNGAAIVSVLSFKSLAANEENVLTAHVENSPAEVLTNTQKNKKPFLNSPNYFAPRNHLNYILKEKANFKPSIKFHASPLNPLNSSHTTHSINSSANANYEKENMATEKRKHYLSAGEAAFILIACIRKKLKKSFSNSHTSPETVTSKAKNKASF